MSDAMMADCGTQELMTLYAKYCHVIDRNDAEGLATCFTDDGVFWVTGQGRFEGREQIMGLVEQTVDGRPRHHTLNVWVKARSDERAEVHAYFQILDLDTAETAAWGHYEDIAVRCADGNWRWLQRHVFFEWTSDKYGNQPGRGRVVPLS